MSGGPSAQVRALIALCLASGCWAFSFGAGTPLASLWLEEAGYSDTIIGLNTGVYYLGIAMSAPLVPWMMCRWGRGCMIAGMILSGWTVGLFPWADSLGVWLVLRWLNGLGGAMSLIPTETLVNHQAAPEQRARNFGYYALAIGLGIALGTLAGIQTYALAPRSAFAFSAMIACVGSGIIYRWLPQATMPEEVHDRTPLAWGRNLLSFGSAWSQGFLEGGMIALLPVYLLAIGFDKGWMSWLMSGTMVGVIAIQVPVAWLADRWGRSHVLLGCYAVVVGGLACLPFCTHAPGLAIWLILVGACSSAYYPLGLAILGERVPSTGLARVNAWFLAINCLGSLTGPVLAGATMDEFGNQALFVVGEVAVVLVLVMWLGGQGYYAWRDHRQRKKAVPSRGDNAAISKAA